MKAGGLLPRLRSRDAGEWSFPADMIIAQPNDLCGRWPWIRTGPVRPAGTCDQRAPTVHAFRHMSVWSACYALRPTDSELPQA